jgi:hypothetical protein
MVIASNKQQRSYLLWSALLYLVIDIKGWWRLLFLLVNKALNACFLMLVNNVRALKDEVSVSFNSV